MRQCYNNNNNDASAAGKLENLSKWYQNLEAEGKNHGYFVNGKKSRLIVKNREMEEHAKTIFGNSVNITSEGKRHLGAVIGSPEYNEEFCKDKVNVWIKELTTLCEIATTHPQMAYTAYLKGYKSKFTYFLRTIENFHNFVSPVDQLLSEKFIPTLFGYDTALTEYRDIFGLNPGEGGLGIPILSNEAQDQHASSLRITEPHVESIMEQETIMRPTNSNGKTIKEIKIDEKKLKQQTRKENIELIDTKMPPSVLGV